MKVDVSLDVPAKYAKDYLSGKVDISKAIVRNKETGKIIKHINLGISDKKEAIKGVAEKIGSKNILIGLGITAVGVTIGGVVNLVINKSKNKASVEIPKCVENFQKCFHKYIKETQKGNLNEKTINDLLSSLDEVEQLKSKEVKIDFSADELKFMLEKIYDFTNNNLRNSEKSKIKLKAPSNNSSKNIVYLKDYLQTQKELIQQVS